MKNPKQLFEEAIDEWRYAKGVGSCYIQPVLDSKLMILMLLEKMYNKSPALDTLIIVNDFTTRMSIIEYLIHQENEENNKEFKTLIDDKKLKILTSNIIESGYRNWATLTVAYNCNLTDKLLYEIECSTFRLIVSNNYITNDDIRNKVYRIAPLLSNSFKISDMSVVKTTLPVEETLVDVSIPEDTEYFKLLEKYNNYITESLNIFDNFDEISYARNGNPKIGLSAQQYCLNIAENNGWHNKLDMNIEFNVKLDELYNPINIRERASKTYEIIRLRSQLVSDFEGKLDYVKQIVDENPNKRFLIISKRGEFASKITDYLNTYYGKQICGNYHNKVENIPAIDEQGNQICYKSGIKKGQQKYLGVTAQLNLTNQLFNSNKINAISTSNLPPIGLNGTFDIVIITSPLCEVVNTYLYRLDSVNFNNKIRLYTIYCKGTIEEKRLSERELSPSHIILNEEKIIGLDDKNFDFIIDD